MAHWRVKKRDGLIALTYEAKDSAPQDCGSGPLSLESSLLGWLCSDAAAVLDTIEIEGQGLFVRMPAPIAFGGHWMRS